ncbi:Fungal specific transcription factor domain containing protein [Metarhizium rileyi]|uniref:Fungal specific transcription factor domain containing protein n=1 Tax=Metarhizium rileyi (strain RCEF 4871) TaxID=1649241 RepID=A0A162M4M4_METRR|nr:Fungal specific transcription factor domain containing protein [Metarhizium rileyi RCEF 4871]
MAQTPELFRIQSYSGDTSSRLSDDNSISPRQKDCRRGACRGAAADAKILVAALPLVGVLSDDFGRKPILLTGIVLICVAGAVQAAATSYAILDSSALELSYRGISIFPTLEGDCVGVVSIYGSLIIAAFVNPIGLKNMGWKYYITFCCLLVMFFLITYFVFPETKGHSLEEIAESSDGQPTLDHEKADCGKRHLTEVEARLERAEALLKQMRTLIPPQARTSKTQDPAANADQAQDGGPAFNFSGLSETTQDHRPDGPSGRGHDGGHATMASPVSSPTHVKTEQVLTVHRYADSDHQRMLEEPPLEEFEWNEKDYARAYSLCPDTGDDDMVEDKPVSDGMASLSVDERESGYLGVASGAALLRLLEPQTRRRAPCRMDSSPSFSTPMTPQPNPNRHITEVMLDAFFRHYHVSYPIVHEPTFRAQYSEVIPRPNGPCWTALAYIVAAIGVWISAPTATDTLDMALFAHARSILGFNFLEVGNLSLVQALTLASNYQQKRDKPNSGYNYLGLSGRMAMGLGLHKEFQGWNIAPLSMEIRRRVWWCLCSFDIGASITFGRPDVWPYKGVEVAFPLNVNDKDLSAASQSYPRESDQMTPYTAVATQARFHIATQECYQKVISKPLPTADEILQLDSSQIEPWKASIPLCLAEGAAVPSRYALPQAIMAWRLRNLRIIMYRPFVIRKALRRKDYTDKASSIAYENCLADAKSTIEMIRDFWNRHAHNRLAAWYGLYFLFQAALIPCICLRNDPSAAGASDWRRQISITFDVIAAMTSLNASSARCHQTISELCSRYLGNAPPAKTEPPTDAASSKMHQEQMPAQTLETTRPWPASQQEEHDHK